VAKFRPVGSHWLVPAYPIKKLFFLPERGQDEGGVGGQRSRKQGHTIFYFFLRRERSGH
jgi:hypothetical protein